MNKTPRKTFGKFSPRTTQGMHLEFTNSKRDFGHVLNLSLAYFIDCSKVKVVLLSQIETHHYTFIIMYITSSRAQFCNPTQPKTKHYRSVTKQ